MTILIILLGSSLIATPQPKLTGTNCPSGYYSSGGFCVPSSSHSRAAIPRSGNSCPSGWVASGNFCQSNR